MNHFSKSYQPVIQTEEVKASKSPKAKPAQADLTVLEELQALRKAV